MIDAAKKSSSICRGFTLLEATVSLVIVSTMLISSLTTVGAFARARNTRQDQSRAMLLAQQLMAEIVQYPYADPSGTSVTLGPDVGETRSTFNDVDDFNGFSETTLTSRAGAALTGFGGWRRSVAVAWVDPANPSSVSFTDKGLKRITVTVTSPSKKVLTLTALRSQNGLYEHSPASPTTFNGWIGVAIQPGTDNTTNVYTSVNPVNLVP
jgi:MSHA pilin protein MshD